MSHFPLTDYPVIPGSEKLTSGKSQSSPRIVGGLNQAVDLHQWYSGDRKIVFGVKYSALSIRLFLHILAEAIET